MERETEKAIRDALVKRAKGYDAEEVVEEYADDGDGGARLVKRRVTVKNYPPDVAAAKLLLVFDAGKEGVDPAALSDEALAEERERLLKILEDIGKDENCQENDL